MTMSTDPDEIRAQIEATRAGLSHDVNELGDKVNPANIVQRQKDKVVDTVRGGVLGVKDHIMGSADTVREGVLGVKDHIMGAGDEVKTSTDAAISSIQDAVTGAPGKVVGQTKGNPMAAGLIAFGAGMLLSALIPASKKEAQAASALKEQAQPLVGQLTSTVREAAHHLQEPAQQALESVKSTAADAVGAVKDEGAAAAGEVKTHALEAKEAVQHTASSS